MPPVLADRPHTTQRLAAACRGSRGLRLRSVKTCTKRHPSHHTCAQAGARTSTTHLSDTSIKQGRHRWCVHVGGQATARSPSVRDMCRPQALCRSKCAGAVTTLWTSGGTAFPLSHSARRRSPECTKSGCRGPSAPAACKCASYFTRRHAQPKKCQPLCTTAKADVCQPVQP